LAAVQLNDLERLDPERRLLWPWRPDFQVRLGFLAAPFGGGLARLFHRKLPQIAVKGAKPTVERIYRIVACRQSQKAAFLFEGPVNLCYLNAFFRRFRSVRFREEQIFNESS